MGKGCQLGVGLHRERTDLVETRGQKNNCPITAHPVKKQMKGQASYQLLVVSPEVRKSKELKGKGVGKWGKGREKKDKIVISKLSHVPHDSLQTNCTTGPREPSRHGGQEFSAVGHNTPQQKEELGTLSPLVVRLS